jgi:hypothetical protein
MNDRRDIERVLDAWLAEGPLEVPDFVFEEAVFRLRSEPRPEWRLPWRPLDMTTPFRLAAAAAVVVAVVGIVALLLPRGPAGPVATPSQAVTTTQAAPTDTPPPTPGPNPTLIPAGVVLLPSDDPEIPDITLTVPSGWTQIGANVIGKNLSSPRELMFLPSFARQVFTEPCNWSGTERDPGPTVSDLVAAFAAVDERNPSAPVDVQIDGQTGLLLTWSVPLGASFSACDVYQGLPRYASWFTVENEGMRYQQAPGQVDMLWVLEIEGRRVIIDAWYMSEATDADIAELRAIVESAEFGAFPSP